MWHAQASKVCNIKGFFVCWVFVRLPGPSEGQIGAARFGTGQKAMFEHEVEEEHRDSWIILGALTSRS